MKESNYYKAKEGYTYERKIDNFIMGNELYLGKFIDGTDDVIDNYDEIKDYNSKYFVYKKSGKYSRKGQFIWQRKKQH